MRRKGPERANMGPMSHRPPAPRILIVDDEDVLRGVVAEYLRSRGFFVEDTGSPYDGLAKAAAGDFELAILDWNLPGMRGRDLLMGVHEASPTTRLLILTGESPEAIRLPREAPVLAGILHKPLSVRLLAETIGQIFRGTPQN